MIEATERVLASVQEGSLSRRDAVQRLVALAAATFAGGAAGAADPDAAASAGRSTVRSVGLNHVALRVTDVERSRDFYRKHLGLEVLRDGSRTCFLAAGRNHFVALFRADDPGLDHYCYTIDDYDAGRVVDTLSAAGLTPARREDRVYFDDPDGITVQLAGEWDDYPGERRD